MITPFFVLFLIFAYLMGSIPFGYLIPKMRGIDIRNVGSKATSSTNVSRAMGWRWGIVNIVMDVLKAFIPTTLALIYLHNDWEIVLAAIMPVIGHVFPVWLKFKGGKGGAPLYGSMIALVGFKSIVVLVGLACFIAILAISKRMSVANLFFSWTLVILVSLLDGRSYLVAFSLLGALFVTVALRENIQRLRNGTEPKTSFKL
jgi:glycerol-3-phosphate acyltransferase PlsY